MFLVIGNRKIKHSEVWFLSDLDDFTNRKIFKFINPVNNKVHIILSETHIDTKKTYLQKSSGKYALKTLEREKVRLLYTSYDIVIEKAKPFGLCYGENKEIHDRNGKVIRTEISRCDFYGQKELLSVSEA